MTGGCKTQVTLHDKCIGGSRGGGARRAPPLRVQILSFWHAKFSKRSHLRGPRPHLRGSRPPLREILDPPLKCINVYNNYNSYLTGPDFNPFQVKEHITVVRSFTSHCKITILYTAMSRSTWFLTCHFRPEARGIVSFWLVECADVKLQEGEKFLLAVLLYLMTCLPAWVSL